MIAANITKTNAFEIFFDGKLVFSKLEQGRMPSLQEVTAPVEAVFAAAQEAMKQAGVAL